MKATGASGGRVQSALLVPVPAAEPLVRRWRLAYDPVAPEGVPAHITLIVPWLPPDRLVEPDFARLADVLADVKAFDFCLATVGWFGRRVLWLGPEPAEPFLALTARLAARFDTPPWGDEFDEVVPHLTVGHDPAWPGRAPAGAAEAGRGGRAGQGGTAPVPAAEAGGELAVVAGIVGPQLPLACRAEEVWVMVGDGGRWHLSRRFRLVT